MNEQWAKIIHKEIHQHEKPLHWYEKLGDDFYYKYLKARERLTGRKTWLHFTYLTNTQCNLKCRECHTYMPYFPKDKHYMADFPTFKKDVDTLLSHLDLMPSFRLQGGEPLMVRDLPKMVKYACSKRQIQHIQVVSNGTILPSEELLEAMKHPKVMLSLSDYSPNQDLKDRLKYAEILELCKARGVNAHHWFTPPNVKWYAKHFIRPRNEEKPNMMWADRNLHYCGCFNVPKVLMLFKGKIYICGPAIFFHHTNPDFQIPDDEVVDITNPDPKDLRRRLYTLMEKKLYSLCGRCNSGDNKAVKSTPGEQIREAQEA